MRTNRKLVPRPGEVKNAVVFFTRGLGDHVIALPALRALGSLFAGKLSMVVSHSAPDMFFGDVGLSRIVAVDMDFKRERGPLYDVPHVAAQLGKQDLFLAVIPGGGDEWAELHKLLQPRWTVGFAKGFEKLLIEDLVHSHSVDEPFRLPQLFDPSLRPEDFSDPFPLPPASVEFVNAMRGALGGRRLLVVHGETKPYKQWPGGRFRAALDAFFRMHPNYVGVEIGRVSSILGDPPPHVLPMTGLPFASSIALAAAADLLLCVDSLFLHIADFWRTPTVALFGPTSPDVWGARFNPMCRYARTAGSMENLPVEAVIEALSEQAAEIERLNYSPGPLSANGAPDLVCWQ